jgi:hypothetical protein
MVLIPFEIEIGAVSPDDLPADVARLGIPGHVVPHLEFLRHDRPPACLPPYYDWSMFDAVIGPKPTTPPGRDGPACIATMRFAS